MTTISMSRRAFVTGLGAVLGAPRAAEAQQTRKLVHVGICSAGQTQSSPLYQAFEQRLRELTSVEGQTSLSTFEARAVTPR